MRVFLTLVLLFFQCNGMECRQHLFTDADNRFFSAIERCLIDKASINSDEVRSQLLEWHNSIGAPIYEGIKQWESLEECIHDTGLLVDSNVDENTVMEVLNCFYRRNYENPNGFLEWKIDAEYLVSGGFLEGLTQNKIWILNDWISSTAIFFCYRDFWPIEIMHQGAEFIGTFQNKLFHLLSRNDFKRAKEHLIWIDFIFRNPNYE